MAVSYNKKAVLDFHAVICEKFGLQYELKDKQIVVIQNLLNKVDVVGVMPTGFGKSECYILPPLYLSLSGHKHIAIVVCPLRSLMFNQRDRLVKMGVAAECIVRREEMSAEVQQNIRDAAYQVLFISPEVIDTWQDVFQSRAYKDRVCLLAVDEAHCLVTWGNTFRPSYGNIITLRTILQVPVVALTATCTKDILKKLREALHLGDQTQIVTELPDRPNIFLEVKPAVMEDMSALDWVILQLKDQGSSAPKILIYCRTIRRCSILAEYFSNELGDAEHDGEPVPENRIIDVYHADMPPEDNLRVLSNFTNAESTLRCIICTVAFGMGIQIPNIRHVLHWGPSNNILSYWQEIGRAGRDGKQSWATLYMVKSQIKDTEEDMKTFCKSLPSSVCMRKDLLHAFVLPGMDCAPLNCMGLEDCCSKKCLDCQCVLCKCCSFCQKRCSCFLQVHNHS